MTAKTNGNGKIVRPRKLAEYRCTNCSRLLFRGVLAPGTRIEIRCWHNSCKYTTVFVVGPLLTMVESCVVELATEGASA